MDESKLLRCDFCDESYSDEEALSIHVLSIHRKIIEGKMKCELCDKTYIIDYFTDFPNIFDLLGKSVRYVTTICGYIIY